MDLLPVSPAAPIRAAPGWPSRIAGLGTAGLLTLGGILGGGSLGMFVDPPSAIIVLGLTGGLSLAAFGLRGLLGAVVVLCRAGGTPEELARTTAVCMGTGTFGLLSGVTGSLIGLVQMLQAMEDPTAIGPAMAVALLTSMYGVGIAAVSFASAFSVAWREPSGQPVEAAAAVSAGVGTLGALSALGGTVLCFFVVLLAMVGGR